MKHLRSSAFLLMALTLAACDPASVSAPDEEVAPTAPYSQQVESLLSTSDSERGLLLRGITTDPFSATGDGVEMLAAAFVVREDGNAEGSLHLKKDDNDYLLIFEQGRVVCDGGMPLGAALEGRGASSGPASETYRGAGPASEPETQHIIIFNLTGSGVDPLRVEVEGELVFGEGACLSR